jgi:hypothetical protein
VDFAEIQGVAVFEVIIMRNPVSSGGSSCKSAKNSVFQNFGLISPVLYSLATFINDQ